tara:strand:+ start:1326 stop:1580 length:255 start_codon:yes stop_codon:yes gene_type:complete
MLDTVIEVCANVQLSEHEFEKWQERAAKHLGIVREHELAEPIHLVTCDKVMMPPAPILWDSDTDSPTKLAELMSIAAFLYLQRI